MPFVIPNQASASFLMQAAPDTLDITVLASQAAVTGVVSGCAVTANGTNLILTVAAGVARIGGRRVTVAGGTVTVTTADPSNPRRDIVSVSTSGTLAVTAGTPAAVTAFTGPVKPALPSNAVLLAEAYVPAGATAALSTWLTDKRVTVSDPGLENVAWYGAAGNGTTDDTAAIQAAVNAAAASVAAGPVVIPPGFMCKTTAALTYTSSTVPLRIIGGGGGQDGSGAPWVSAIRPNFVGHALDIQNAPFFSVTDLAILADGTNSGGATADYVGVYTKGVNRVECQRLQIAIGAGNFSFNSAVQIVGAANSSLVAVSYLAGEQQAIWMDGGGGMTIRDTFAASTPGNGYGAIRMDNTSGSSTGPGTINIENVVTFRGDWGFWGGGTGNSPVFVFASNFQVNNPRVGGFYMQAGSQVWLDRTWISMAGVGAGHNETGVLLDTGFQGWFYMSMSVIQTCSNHGIWVKGGQGIAISATSFGGCGYAAGNTYDALHIASGVSYVTVEGCHFDVDKWNTHSSPVARSAIYIEAGASAVLLAGNIAAPSGWGTAALIDSGAVATHGTNIGF